MFALSFDPQSLKEIAAFAGFGVLLSEEIQQAEQQVGELIVTKTHDNAMARFVNNSPGGLAESFGIVPQSPYELLVGSDKPHAHRRDQGFGIGGTAATDSLGRVYHDKPYLYFSDAVSEVETSGEGMEILQAAVYTAIERVGGGF